MPGESHVRSWSALLSAWHADPKGPTVRQELFARLRPIVAECAQEHARRWAHPLDAEELADEILIDVIESGPSELAPHVKPEDVRGTLLRDHLRTVTSRVAKKLYRNQRKGPVHIPRDQILNVPAPNSPSREEEGRVGDEVGQVVACLNERDQELVRLKIDEGLSNAEIAEILHVKEVAVRVRWYRLKKKLARLLLSLQRPTEGG